MRSVSGRDAYKVLRRVCALYDVEPDPVNGPWLSMDWRGGWYEVSPRPAVVWEGGPTDWVDVGAADPVIAELVFAEPSTSYALSLYPKAEACFACFEEYGDTALCRAGTHTTEDGYPLCDEHWAIWEEEE